jgi:hypothetical protein
MVKQADGERVAKEEEKAMVFRRKKTVREGARGNC